MELAVHRSDQDDIEELEGVVGVFRVCTCGDEVETVEGGFAVVSSKVTMESERLCESGGGDKSESSGE